MVSLTARAPGKIILAGEHAVVHGSAAVAASIDLCTFATLSFPPSSDNDDDTIRLQLKDMGLDFSWPIKRIREALGEVRGCDASSPKSCSPETLKSIAALVAEVSIPEANYGLAAGVTAFLWLYTSIQGYKAGEVVITSELPLGAGLGSSAAFCVSLSAALLSSSDVVRFDDVSDHDWLMLGENDLDLVNKWAFVGETIIHGKPSGIDNTVSTFGNMIKFKSGELMRIKSTMPLKMLITNTKVGRNTKALVAGVSERKLRHPVAMDSVFTAVDSISNELTAVISSPVSGNDLSVTDKEQKLEELMEMNQGLLQCMGVSHPCIETVVRTTKKYNLVSKLTGAGGGGCVLTLLPTLLSHTIIDKASEDLESSGFHCLIAGIGGNGVEIQFGDSR